MTISLNKHKVNTMKKLVLALILIQLSCHFSWSQNSSHLERSIYGIQIGLVGIYTYDEHRIGKEITLRTELGYDAGPFYFDGNNFRSSLTFSPVISLEPRWYYNLDRRVSKSKKVAGNTGSFLSIKISYDPDWLVFNTSNNTRTVGANELSIVPTWGLRRSFGKNLTFETGFGLGYGRILDSSVTDANSLIGNIHLRFGFDFKRK